ncbi:hypothetical protein E3E38_06030 [Thermococcus sp. 18S1]|uniref:hypothetical protein n=1 Tax=Thermococcus sp. 18S1 TaxID=1638210 RepID=UPI00143AEC56|nr:hypothetical protein [Thermococcus sp. 18S1]NJE30605.1 hypothetical protein [Thermococcus sp. 18S1]
MATMTTLEERELLALEEMKEFARRAKELIAGITVETLVDEGGINPYMVAALGLDLDTAIEMFIHKRVERSLGTSFGQKTMEKFLAVLLGGTRGKDLDGCTGRGQKPWYCWWDIIIQRPYTEGNKTFDGVVLAVKSSYTNVNKDIVEKFVDHAKEAIEHNYRPFLVFTYGKHIWSVVTSTLPQYGMNPEDYVIVGRQIYEKFLGVGREYYDELIEKIIETTKAEHLALSEAIELKVQELKRELHEMYGEDISRLLKDLS